MQKLCFALFECFDLAWWGLRAGFSVIEANLASIMKWVGAWGSGLQFYFDNYSVFFGLKVLLWEAGWMVGRLVSRVLEELELKPTQAQT